MRCQKKAEVQGENLFCVLMQMQIRLEMRSVYLFSMTQRSSASYEYSCLDACVRRERLVMYQKLDFHRSEPHFYRHQSPIFANLRELILGKIIMKFLLPFAMLIPMQVTAYEAQTEYRVYGDEIVSIVVPEIEIEAPLAVIINTAHHGELRIESDQSLEDCTSNLNRVKGDTTAFVQIVVRQNGHTMNGVMVVQCSVSYR